MEKRSWNDLLKLFAWGIVAAAGGFALMWFMAEDIHLSSQWRLFIFGHVGLVAIFLWYLRPMLRHVGSFALIIVWMAGHLLIAVKLVEHEVPVLYVLIAFYLEYFALVKIAKGIRRLAKDLTVPNSDGHPEG